MKGLGTSITLETEEKNRPLMEYMTQEFLFGINKYKYH